MMRGEKIRKDVMGIVDLIVGNTCSLLAMGTDALSASRKTAKGVLWVQNASQAIYFTSAVVLKGYSGAVQNVMSILRNLLAISGKSSKVVEWSLTVLGVVLGIVFNNIGIMGYMPIIANLQYTIAVFRFKDNERALKISFAIAAFLFALFSLAIRNYVGVATNLTVMVITIIFLLKSSKK